MKIQAPILKGRQQETKRKKLLDREIRQYRLPVDTIEFIERIAAKRSVARTSVISWAVRDLADKEGVGG